MLVFSINQLCVKCALYLCSTRNIPLAIVDPHPYHIATRLTRDEQKLVQISKELKARTYRIKVGHTVHIDGLMRLDVEELSVDSIYVTVWASLLLPLHMGKTENADRMLLEHFGQQLQGEKEAFKPFKN